METENNVITASQKEEELVTPVVVVIEEHVPVSNEEASKENDGDDSDDQDDIEKGLMENIVEEDYEEDIGLSGDLSGFDNDELDSFFDYVDEKAKHHVPPSQVLRTTSPLRGLQGSWLNKKQQAFLIAEKAYQLRKAAQGDVDPSVQELKE
uniref:Uncharacterized protein n=1 Tax=Lactuca sativa TaxID=4236 RepID=A0A9R1WAH1_LACSA|nr:hypothetical protein LSAT_V11C200066630 [Lactuca sativa]